MLSQLRLAAILILLAPGAGYAAPGPAQSAVQSDPFTPCADTDLHPALAATDCAFVDVPLDHAQPVRGEIEIFVRRIPAEGEAHGQIWLLAFAMTRIPMGVAYAVWSGLGIVAIAAIGWIVFHQSLTLAQAGFMALFLIGAIGLNLTTVRTAV